MRFPNVLQLTLVLVCIAGYGSQARAAEGTGEIGLFSFHPSLPITGGGPIFNFNQGDQAMTNALAHIGWAVAIPLVGEKLGGTKGKWIAGVGWITLTLVQESLFHAPKNPSAGYASEVRTDLLTRIAPTLLVLAW